MNADYNPTPTPDSLTIRRDQETDCSNITIADDTLVEEDKGFGVVIVANASTFTAGVNIVQNSTFMMMMVRKTLLIPSLLSTIATSTCA